MSKPLKKNREQASQRQRAHEWLEAYEGQGARDGPEARNGQGAHEGQEARDGRGARKGQGARQGWKPVTVIEDCAFGAIAARLDEARSKSKRTFGWPSRCFLPSLRLHSF